MKQDSFRLVTIPILLAIVSLLSSCAIAGMAISQEKKFSLEKSYSLEGVTQDPLKLAQQAGQLLGMNVISIDRKNGTLLLDATSSMAVVILIGKGHHNQIEVQVNKTTNALDINVMVEGNFGEGTPESAQKVLDQYIDKLDELKS